MVVSLNGELDSFYHLIFSVNLLTFHNKVYVLTNLSNFFPNTIYIIETACPVFAFEELR